MSWYEGRDDAPHAFLIHPDEFTTYVNLELLPTLLLPNEPHMVAPIRIDPFHMIPWQHEEARQVPLSVGNDTTVCTEYVWTAVQQLRGNGGILAPTRGGPDNEGGTSLDAIWVESPGERPPTYRRNEGRHLRGTQTPHPQGHARGTRPTRVVQ